MAGHSKWANIQHRKGRQDKLRSKLFSKLSKEITVAAKMGDPDPEKNPRLRMAVKEAKSNSVPKDVTKHIKTSYPGSPSGGGSDNASFVAAGVPAFSLSSLNWSYWNYTWHTNRDTYDKIIFDDVRNNVILTAVLAYMASEDDSKTSRERIIMPIDSRTGKQRNWPTQRSPQRKGGL